jgi:hypothetical protein
MGPQEWMKTSSKIVNVSPILGEAFKLMANFLNPFTHELFEVR